MLFFLCHLGLEHSGDILTNTRSTATNAMMRWMCWQMQYHTAHHMFPSVPFWKLRALNAEMERGIGGPPQRMSYLAFQWEVIRKLSGGKSEALSRYSLLNAKMVASRAFSPSSSSA